MIDILAIQEAIEVKSQLESQRFSRDKKKQEKQKQMEKLRNGKNTIKTIFMSKSGKVDKITNLNRQITAVIN